MPSIGCEDTFKISLDEIVREDVILLNWQKSCVFWCCLRLCLEFNGTVFLVDRSSVIEGVLCGGVYV